MNLTFSFMSQYIRFQVLLWSYWSYPLLTYFSEKLRSPGRPYWSIGLKEVSIGRIIEQSSFETVMFIFPTTCSETTLQRGKPSLIPWRFPAGSCTIRYVLFYTRAVYDGIILVHLVCASWFPSSVQQNLLLTKGFSQKLALHYFFLFYCRCACTVGF